MMEEATTCFLAESMVSYYTPSQSLLPEFAPSSPLLVVPTRHRW